MAIGIKLHIWGEYACFTRPEMKVERVSYDVITPSAARGILSAIHWKPAMNWIIDRIHVLKPIRFESIRRNELGGKIPLNNVKKAIKSKSVQGLYTLIEEDRQQRAATVLKEVAYIIEAHIQLNHEFIKQHPRIGNEDNIGKHLGIFTRRVRDGQCFQQPCMGVREFPANFALIEENKLLPVCELPENERSRDFGWMLDDIDFAHGNTPHCFHAEMKNGIIEIPHFRAAEVKS